MKLSLRRRDVACVVCGWHGPRNRMWRWGPGNYVCRNEEACQWRHTQKSYPVTAKAAETLRDAFLKAGADMSEKLRPLAEALQKAGKK